MSKVLSSACAVALFLYFILPIRAQQPNSEMSGRLDSNTLDSAVAPKDPVNVNAVAILRWYNANLTRTFAVGIAPSALAFDGANVWVTDPSGDQIIQLRAIDGKELQTVSMAEDPEP